MVKSLRDPRLRVRVEAARALWLISGQRELLFSTLIEGLGPACRTNQEEIFGPVVTLTPFEDEEEVLEAIPAFDL